MEVPATKQPCQEKSSCDKIGGRKLYKRGGHGKGKQSRQALRYPNHKKKKKRRKTDSTIENKLSVCLYIYLSLYINIHIYKYL